MANHSTYLSTAILNATYRAQAFPAIAQVYVGLFTAAPTDAGGGTEVSTSGGTNYARTPITFAAPSGTPPAVENSADVVFPVAAASWGALTHIGLFDAVSGGNLLDWNPIVDPGDLVTPISVSIGVGERFVLAAGNVVARED